MRKSSQSTQQKQQERFLVVLTPQGRPKAMYPFEKYVEESAYTRPSEVIHQKYEEMEKQFEQELTYQLQFQPFVAALSCYEDC